LLGSGEKTFVRVSRPRATPVIDLPYTEAGQTASEGLRKKLFAMLSSAALMRGNRRRASALDVTDFEAAFDDLVNPPARPLWLDVAAQIGMVIGGGFIGFGTSVLAGGMGRENGWIPVISGSLVAIASVIVQHIKLK
jgi:hypothetical protein